MKTSKVKIGDKIMGYQMQDQLQKYDGGLYAGTILNIEVIEKSEHGMVYYRGIEYYIIEPLPGTVISKVEDHAGVVLFNEEKWNTLKELYDNKIISSKEFFDFEEKIRCE
jgi:hypothetical protein